MSIMGNCDTQLVLGFQDLDTAHCFSERANRMPKTLLELSPERSWLFVRGRAAEEIESYHLEEHPRYFELREGEGLGREEPAPASSDFDDPELPR